MGLDAGAWSAFAHDPRDPAHAGLRASDADRITAEHLLDEAYAEGRLDLDEHGERTARARGARLLGDLVPLLADLVPRLVPPQGREIVRATPGELRDRAVQEWHEDRRSALMGFLGPTLICWAIYLALAWDGGPHLGDFPWPLIVTAVTLVNLLRVQVSRTELVAKNLAELEKKQAKALAKAQRPQKPSRALRSAPQELAAEIASEAARRLGEKLRPPGPPGSPGPS